MTNEENVMQTTSAQVNPNLAALSKLSANNAQSTLDGFTWHIVKTGGTDGLIFDVSELTVGETYTFSFKVQKTSGSLQIIGGHAEAFTQKKFTIDGVDQSTSYMTGATVADDSEVREVVFTGVYHGNANTKNLYLQPNRRLSIAAECDVWDIKVEVGDTATTWIPAEEDAPVEPVIKYLFNGVELPALPPKPSDNTTLGLPYDYMIIVDETYNGDVVFALHYMTEKAVIWENGRFVTADTSRHTQFAHEVYLYHEGGEWERNGYSCGIHDSDGYLISTERENDRIVIWANHDILNPDGSVYFAASYPIDAETGEEITDYGLYPTPVTPSEPIDPTSMLLGWLVGRRIAGQRGKQQKEPIFSIQHLFMEVHSYDY